MDDTNTNKIIEAVENEGLLLRSADTNSIKSLNEVFDKFNAVLDSVNSNIILQSAILQKTLDIEETRELAARLASVDQSRVLPRNGLPAPQNRTETPTTETGSTEGISAGIASLIGGALGAMSVAGFGRLLARGSLLTFMAPVLGEWIGNLAKEGLDNFNPGGSGVGGFNESMSDALGSATTMGFIGRIFGKKVALIFAAGGFVASFGDELFKKLDADKDGIIEAFGKELTPDNLSAIMGAVAGAVALALPMLIRRGLLPALSRAVGTSAAARAAAGAAASSAARNPTTGEQTPRQRNFTYDADTDEYYSNRTDQRGRRIKLTGGARATAERTRLADDAILAQAAKRFPGFSKLLKANAVVGSLISLPFIASILMNDELSEDEKIAAVSGEIGALLGGVGGAATGAAIAGALGASVTGPGGILTGIAGGVLGAFAGDWVGTQIGEMIVGNKSEFDELPPEVEASVPELSISGSGRGSIVEAPGERAQFMERQATAISDFTKLQDMIDSVEAEEDPTNQQQMLREAAISKQRIITNMNPDLLGNFREISTAKTRQANVISDYKKLQDMIDSVEAEEDPTNQQQMLREAALKGQTGLINRNPALLDTFMEISAVPSINTADLDLASSGAGTNVSITYLNNAPVTIAPVDASSVSTSTGGSSMVVMTGNGENPTSLPGGTN
jgi:hypothetical protein